MAQISNKTGGTQVTPSFNTAKVNHALSSTQAVTSPSKDGNKTKDTFINHSASSSTNSTNTSPSNPSQTSQKGNKGNSPGGQGNGHSGGGGGGNSGSTLPTGNPPTSTNSTSKNAPNPADCQSKGKNLPGKDKPGSILDNLGKAFKPVTDGLTNMVKPLGESLTSNLNSLGKAAKPYMPALNSPKMVDLVFGDTGHSQGVCVTPSTQQPQSSPGSQKPSLQNGPNNGAGNPTSNPQPQAQSGGQGTPQKVGAQGGSGAGSGAGTKDASTPNGGGATGKSPPVQNKFTDTVKAGIDYVQKNKAQFQPPSSLINGKEDVLSFFSNPKDFVNNNLKGYKVEPYSNGNVYKSADNSRQFDVVTDAKGNNIRLSGSIKPSGSSYSWQLEIRDVPSSKGSPIIFHSQNLIDQRTALANPQQLLPAESMINQINNYYKDNNNADNYFQHFIKPNDMARTLTPSPTQLNLYKPETMNSQELKLNMKTSDSGKTIGNSIHQMMEFVPGTNIKQLAPGSSYVLNVSNPKVFGANFITKLLTDKDGNRWFKTGQDLFINPFKVN